MLAALPSLIVVVVISDHIGLGTVYHVQDVLPELQLGLRVGFVPSAGGPGGLELYPSRCPHSRHPRGVPDIGSRPVVEGGENKALQFGADHNTRRTCAGTQGKHNMSEIPQRDGARARMFSMARSTRYVEPLDRCKPPGFQRVKPGQSFNHQASGVSLGYCHQDCPFGHLHRMRG